MRRGQASDTCQLLDQGGMAYAGLRRILQGMILALKPKIVVEIGTYKGFSTAVMALSANLLWKKLKNVYPKIYAVDPGKHGQRPTVQDIAGKKANVKFIFKRAQDVEEKDIKLPIDLLFVDGDHAYESTKEICDKWFRWMRPGGIVVMHDVRMTDKIGGDKKREYGVWKYWEEIKYPKLMLVDMKPGIGIVEIPAGPVPDWKGEIAKLERFLAQERDDKPEGMIGMARRMGPVDTAIQMLREQKAAIERLKSETPSNPLLDDLVGEDMVIPTTGKMIDSDSNKEDGFGDLDKKEKEKPQVKPKRKYMRRAVKTKKTGKGNAEPK